jgi:transcriptional regulator with XRE-family HTH domain
MSEMGALMRGAREARGLSQAELAARSGVSESMISRLERGERRTFLDVVDRLLAALGLQLRYELEPLGADLDRLIDEAAQVPLVERLKRAGVMMHYFVEWLEEEEVDYVIEGAAAALLQGVPVPVLALEIAVQAGDIEAFARMLRNCHAKRWDPMYREWGYCDPDPRVEGGPLRWQVSVFGELHARLVEALPEHVVVEIGGHSYPVRPLVEVEVSDPATARIVARARARLAAAEGTR